MVSANTLCKKLLNVKSVVVEDHGKRKLFPSQVALIRHYDSIPVFSPLRIFPKYSIS